MSRLNILFLCTGNACRSQMAEGWANALKPDSIQAYSAGTDPHGLDPRSVTVMAEVGIDIAAHRSKHVSELLAIPFDVVITVCDRVTESCPVFPGKARIVHHGFEDPPRLAQYFVDPLDAYRQVRDEIKAFIETLPQSLATKETDHAGKNTH